MTIFCGRRERWLSAPVILRFKQLDIDIRQLEAADLLARLLMVTTSFSNPTRIVLISSSRGYDQNNLISYESRRLLHSCLSTHLIAFVRPLDSFSNTNPLMNNWRVCLNINLWFSVGQPAGYCQELEIRLSGGLWRGSS